MIDSGTKSAAPPPMTWKRQLRRLVWLLAGFYVGVLLVLLALERRFIFHPTRAPEHWTEAPPEANAQDITLSLPSGDLIHGWWCPTANWQPEQGALLYFHGNAGNLSDRGEGIVRLQKLLRQAVLIIDYPGYGKCTGKPDEPACYAAADAAYDWLVSERGVAPERLLLHGRSLGGAIAIELATRRTHRALIVVSTFTSIPDMAAKIYPWIWSRPFIRTRFDNLAKIGQCPRPVFLAHGTADRYIPYRMGESLFTAAGEPKRLFPMEGYDHNHAPGLEFYAAVDEFLHAHAPLP
jgi:fermentation-respiration switch protein FrsA (DUF1100 family)